MTGDGDALMAAILAHPDEDAPRLIYADWLQEQGDEERAEFIRVQCELAKFADEIERTSPYTRDLVAESRRVALRGRERALFNSNVARWRYRHVQGGECLWGLFIETAPPGAATPHTVYARGFVERVACTAADWLKHADAILAAHPVERVTLTTWPEWEWTDGVSSIYYCSPQQFTRLPGRRSVEVAWNLSLRERLKVVLERTFAGIVFELAEGAI